MQSNLCLFSVVFFPTPGCWRCQHRCWGRGWRGGRVGLPKCVIPGSSRACSELLVFVTVLAALSCQPSLSAYWLGAKVGGGLLILSVAQRVVFKGICELIKKKKRPWKVDTFLFNDIQFRQFGLAFMYFPVNGGVNFEHFKPLTLKCLVFFLH